MHGEYHNIEHPEKLGQGSPPYARGIQHSISSSSLQARITPVCTGNTVTMFNGISVVEDHPRMHGEYSR